MGLGFWWGLSVGTGLVDVVGFDLLSCGFLCLVVLCTGGYRFRRFVRLAAIWFQGLDFRFGTCSFVVAFGVLLFWVVDLCGDLPLWWAVVGFCFRDIDFWIGGC